MTDLQIVVLFVFTLTNLGVTLYNHHLRYPGSKSRREQIARIRAEEKRKALLR